MKTAVYGITIFYSHDLLGNVTRLRDVLPYRPEDCPIRKMRLTINGQSLDVEASDAAHGLFLGLMHVCMGRQLNLEPLAHYTSELRNLTLVQDTVEFLSVVLGPLWGVVHPRAPDHELDRRALV